MASLFISYSRKDIDIARNLTKAFNRKDLDFWIDWEGIHPTVDWWREIERGIEEADIFLFLLSPDSAKSEVCNREIEHAAKNGKRLIPVVVRDIKADESPSKLKALNWIFLREIDDFDEGFSKLITAIKADYEWVQTHRQLQVKALEWERNNHENSFLLRGKELKDAELQLVTNSSKEPYPTDLQREYILKSRQISDRQRRITTSISFLTAIVMAGLAMYGFVQARRAEERANIALARQLAAQAQEIYSKGDSREDTAVLLAAQSMRLFATIEAAQILQTNTLAKTISRLSDVCIGISEEGIRSSAVSPDGEYIVSSTFGGLCLWKASTGKVIARIAHDGYVSSVSFSPDGKFIVSGSDDSTIRIWEAFSAREVIHIDNGSKVVSIDFNSEGTKIVSAGEDSTARVWDIFTGSEIARMSHQDWVSSVSFSPDGKFVVSGSADGTARVWNADTGDEISQMAHGGMVWSVEFSPDGRTVVSGSEDGTARVWDASSGIEIARMTHQGQVFSVSFSPKGNLVLSGGCDDRYYAGPCTKGTVIAWDPATGREFAHMTHDGSVSTVFSPDGKFALSTGTDATVRVWDPFTGIETARMTHTNTRPIAVFSPDSRFVVSGDLDVRVWNINTSNEIARTTYDNSTVFVALSPDGSKVVSGGCDHVELNNCLQGSVRVWETTSGKEIARLTIESIVTSVAFSPDGEYIVSGSDDGTARVWQANTGKEISRISSIGRISSLAFSPDGIYVVSGGCYKQIDANRCEVGNATVWETKSGNQASYQTFKNTVLDVLFSPNGKFVAAASQSKLVVWETTTGKKISEITYEIGWVTAIAFSPDSKFIVAASTDATARVWEIYSGNEISRVEFDNYASSVAFSPDGKYVVAGGCDEGHEDVTCTKGSARVWVALSGREIATLTHDNDVVTSVAFNPDGKYVISGGGDNTARIWDITTKNEVARMTHDSWVSSVEFSPNGQYVVSGSNDGTARVWAWRSEDLIANACDRLTRNLSRAEWKQYVGDAMPYQVVCSKLPIEPEPTAAATP